MTAGPHVRVCVPTYNAESTLAETLGSILGQTYRNLSVVVVDNASTDRTAEIADSYAARDERLTVSRNAENVGGEGNFTRCLQLAAGDYTAIFHSDDIYLPDMVAGQVAMLESFPEAGAVFVMPQAIDAAGRPGRVFHLPAELRGKTPPLFGFEEVFRVLLKYGNFFFCPGVMARSAIYREQIAKWDAGGFLSSADLDVWLRILKRHKITVIDEPLFRYRISANSFTYNITRRKTGPHDMRKVFDAYIAGEAARLMGPAQRADYAMLILLDDINRALNHFAAGEGRSARALLGGLFGASAWLSALTSLYHARTLLMGLFVYCASLLPLGESARHAIVRARYR